MTADAGAPAGCTEPGRAPLPPPDATPLPAGFGIELDPSLRSYDAGQVLVGGAPPRLLRLSDGGRAAVAALRDGAAAAASARSLARRMVDAGLAHPTPPPAGHVEITVVVPVHERVEELDGCLTALSTPRVVVVDDGSTRGAEIAAVCARHGATLVRREERGGPGAARNAGLERVDTELVAFLDSDCLPSPDWLSALARHFADPLVGMAAPRVHPRAAAGVSGRIVEGRSPLDMGPVASEVGPGKRVPYVPTAALLARTAAMQAFDRDLRVGEDVDLVWRVRDAGWRIRYDPTAQVAHREPGRWRDVLRRRARYGTSAAPLAQRHRGRLAPAILRPGAVAVLALLAARRPALAVLVLALSTWAFDRRLARHDLPRSWALARSAESVWHTLVNAGRAATMLAAPALLAGLTDRRTRLAAAALLIAPPVDEWVRKRPRVDCVRWTVACVVDDAAYGAGVWRGCLRERTVEPLLPAWG